MKKITLLILCILAFGYSYSQCTTSTGGQWPTTTVNVNNNGGVQTIDTQNWPNAEFSILENIQPGSDYTVAANPTTYITVTNTADGSVIVHGLDSVSFTAPAGVTGLTIYWHLDAACGTQANRNTTTTIQCTTCTCTETQAPAAATTPNPADGATDVVIDFSGATPLITPFEWVDGTGAGTVESYNLSLGTDPAGTNIGTLTDFPSGNGITYGSWTPNTTYFWSVTAVNCFGSTQSAIWSFTTENCTVSAPGQVASADSPTDGATDVPIIFGTSANTVGPFSWTPGAGDPADSFIFNLGTSPLDPTGIGSIPGFESGNNVNYSWASNTTYYWRVDAVNCGGTTEGPTFSFTTSACTASAAPNPVINPGPADGATNVAFDQTDPMQPNKVFFNWDDAVGEPNPATGYTLNLGTTNPPTDSSFDNFTSGDFIFNLSADTQYFWSITANNCTGSSTPTVWSFTTEEVLSVDDVRVEGFKIYPNPTTDILNIKTTLNLESVQVMNLFGQVVARFNSNMLVDNSINISDLAEGIYMVTVRAEGKKQTFKIVKE